MFLRPKRRGDGTEEEGQKGGIEGEGRGRGKSATVKTDQKSCLYRFEH